MLNNENESAYRMIIVTNEALSEDEYNLTRLEVINYSKKEDDVIFRTDTTTKIISVPGMPKFCEYVPTVKLKEVTVITEIDSTTVKSELIDPDTVELTMLEPIIIRYDIEAGTHQLPVIVRLDPGYTFEEPFINIPNKAALKSILALEAVEQSNFQPLQFALKQSMEEEL